MSRRRYYLAVVTADGDPDNQIAVREFNDRADAFAWINRQAGGQRWVSLMEHSHDDAGMAVEVEITCYGDTDEGTKR